MPSTVRYHFVPGGEAVPGFDGETTKTWNAYERRQVVEALATFETFADVEFAPTNNPRAANFTLYSFDASDDGILGAFELPQCDGTSDGFFNHRGSGWDENDPRGGLEQGGYAFITLIHEFGHGLGLEHPHEGTGRNFPGVSELFSNYGASDLNQGIYTTMSYNDGWQTEPHGLPPSFDYGYQGTPMAVDIAALQDLYGANTNHHDGKDAYTLPTANASGTFYESLWDTGGVDTIRAGSTGRDAVIDLNDATLRAEVGGGGFVSYARGIHGGFTIANGVLIENATGGRGDDRLIGNEARNVLTGGDGDDRLTGGFGADRLTAGSAGRDTFIFEAVRESSEGEGIDRITDFDRSDEIDLRDIDWSGDRGDQAFAFVTGPLTEAGEVHVRQAQGYTFIEAEVNGAGDADLVVRLDGLVTLREGDFLL